MSAVDIANVVFGVGGIVFILAMLPTLLGRHSQVPRSSSLTTGLVLATFLFPYALLGTWFAFASNAALAFLWLMVAVYRPLKKDDRIL